MAAGGKRGGAQGGLILASGREATWRGRIASRLALLLFTCLFCFPWASLEIHSLLHPENAKLRWHGLIFPTHCSLQAKS